MPPSEQLWKFKIGDKVIRNGKKATIVSTYVSEGDWIGDVNIGPITEYYDLEYQDGTTEVMIPSGDISRDYYIDEQLVNKCPNCGSTDIGPVTFHVGFYRRCSRCRNVWDTRKYSL